METPQFDVRQGNTFRQLSASMDKLKDVSFAIRFLTSERLLGEKSLQGCSQCFRRLGCGVTLLTKRGHPADDSGIGCQSLLDKGGKYGIAGFAPPWFLLHG